MKEYSNLRYPRKLLATELLSQKKIKNTQVKIVDDMKEELPNEVIKDIKTKSFQFSGAYPFLFDALTYLCKMNPKDENDNPIITPIENSYFLHATISWEDFKKFALGDYHLSLKENLITELKKIQQDTTPKYFTLGENYIIKANPVIVNPIYKLTTNENKKNSLKNLINHRNNVLEEKKKKREEELKKKEIETYNKIQAYLNAQLENIETKEYEKVAEKINMYDLKKIIDAASPFLQTTNENIFDKDDSNNETAVLEGVELIFYAPLFISAMDNIENQFIQIGTCFQAKLETAIRKYKKEILTEGIFAKYRKIQRYPIVYRRYAIFLASKFNNVGSFISINAKDLLLNTDPQQLNTNLKIRNLSDMKIFVDKANLLLNKMGKDGLMQGFKFIPTKCRYNETTQEFTINITKSTNQNEIPDYEGCFTAEELSKINEDLAVKIIQNAF